ncbi:MAG: toxin-antitoxin system HicB family antitoxin [Rhodoferax sp.]|nr:toxin-antitoxin system HicB family antitoxin [Rhodoferax sp.]
MAPEIHRAALIVAQASGQNLNQWAAQVLPNAAHR